MLHGINSSSSAQTVVVQTLWMIMQMETLSARCGVSAFL